LISSTFYVLVFVQKKIAQLFLVTFWFWQKDFGKKSTFVQKTPA